MRSISSGKRRRSYLGFLMVFFTVLLLVGTVPVYATSNDYSVEDMFVLFSGNATGDTEGSSLPTWITIKQISENSKALDNLKGEEKTRMQNKIELSNKIILGFGKSSSYNKWKEKFDKNCRYSTETKEILAINGDEATEDELMTMSSVMSEFDNAMLKADVQIMSGSNAGETDLGGFGRVVTNVTGLGISIVRAIIFEIGRIGLSIGSLVCVCELFYVGVEPLRPILGIESKPFIKRTRNQETGLSEKVEDHGVVFRLVGQSARKAVEDEFKIESMDNVIKNNILLSFLWKKIKYMVAIVLAIVLINTNVWGWICIKIVDIGAGLLG